MVEIVIVAAVTVAMEAVVLTPVTAVEVIERTMEMAAMMTQMVLVVAVAGNGLASGWVGPGLQNQQNHRVRRTRRYEVVPHCKTRKNLHGAGGVVKDCSWIERALLYRLVVTWKCFDSVIGKDWHL